MNSNEEGLKLIKDFAVGADCAGGLDQETVKLRPFWPCLEEIASRLGFSEVNVIVVKKYIFENHNQIVAEIFKKGRCSFGEAVNCMVRAIRIENKIPACIHGKTVVCEITEYEFEELIRTRHEIMENLQRGVR